MSEEKKRERQLSSPSSSSQKDLKKVRTSSGTEQLHSQLNIASQENSNSLFLCARSAGPQPPISTPVAI